MDTKFQDNNPVLLVIPRPRAPQIKGWRRTYRHMVMLDQALWDYKTTRGHRQQRGRGRWAHSPPMIPATCWCHRKDPDEKHFSNVSLGLNSNSEKKNSLAGGCWPPNTCCVFSIVLSESDVPGWWELKARRSHGLFLNKMSLTFSRKVRSKRAKVGLISVWVEYSLT